MEVDHTLLAVSNDPLVREGVLYGFPASVEVLLAGDAREAVALLEEIIPSAVLIDLHTRSSGGYALSRDMSQDARLIDVPILMLLEREQDLWLAGQARAKIVRVKPIPAGGLIDDLMSLMLASKSAA